MRDFRPLTSLGIDRIHMAIGLDSRQSPVSNLQIFNPPQCVCRHLLYVPPWYFDGCFRIHKMQDDSLHYFLSQQCPFSLPKGVSIVASTTRSPTMPIFLADVQRLVLPRLRQVNHPDSHNWIRRPTHVCHSDIVDRHLCSARFVTSLGRILAPSSC